MAFFGLSHRTRSLTGAAAGVLAIAALCSPARADILINSFETPADLSIPISRGAVLSRSPVHNSDGDWSAQIDFDDAPGSSVHFDNRVSWWNMSGLAFDAATDEEVPVRLGVTIRSGHSSLKVLVTIQPGREAHVVIPCDTLARGQIDPQDFGAYSISASGSPLLLTSISGFDIGLAGAGEKHVIFLDNVRLVSLADEHGPILVDDYGQYAPSTWPGKVAQDEEMRVDVSREPLQLAGLKTHHTLDRFGSEGGGNLRESPFFRVEKVRGRWRFVNPLGHEEFLRGVNAVSIESAAAAPGPDGIYSLRTTHEGRQDFYRANLELKYGDDFHSRWSETTRRRLSAWGFNALGPGSEAIPGFVRVVDAGDSRHITGVHHLGPFPDVFDSTFSAAAAKSLEGIAAGREEQSVVGYTFDHALPWERLLDPAFVMAQGGAAAEHLQSEARLAHPTEPGPQPADMPLFLSTFADRYFKGIADAIRASDHGHHLYLGCRFTSAPLPVVTACKKYVDVLTFDAYGSTPGAALAGAAASDDRPILISAFSFGAADRGLLDGGPVTVESQLERAGGYERYLRACEDSASIVGCFWDRYIDESLLVGHRPGANLGLVSITDRPYPELTTVCREANLELAGARADRRTRTASGAAGGESAPE